MKVSSFFLIDIRESKVYLIPPIRFIVDSRLLNLQAWEKGEESSPRTNKVPNIPGF